MNATITLLKRSTFLAIVGCCTLLSSGTMAGTKQPPGLFSDGPGNSRAALPEQAIAARSRSVVINQDQLKKGRFFISLPGDVSFEAVQELHQDLGNGRSAWVGHASDDKRSRVVIGVSGTATAATFSYRGKLFKLEPRADGSHIVSEVLSSDPAPELPPIGVDTPADTATTSSAGFNGAAAAEGNGPVLDVLVAYTPAVQAIYGKSGAEALIIQAVAETNQAYANSGMDTRLNLVHSVATAYTESGNMSTDLSRLRSTSDGYMDELHALRDNYSADLVSLFENEAQYCGIAYRMKSLSTSFASSAFSVVHHSCATGYYSFAHEIGHNQGAHHDSANASGAIFEYAYGYQDTVNDFRTIMSYDCSGGCTRVAHFSNSQVTYNGKPTGILYYTENAHAISNTDNTVANFRQHPEQTPPASPADLSALANGYDAVTLQWVDMAQDETGVILERSMEGSAFTAVASLPANSTSYSDEGLSANTLYTYRVKAWNSNGDSAYSNQAVAATESMPEYIDQFAHVEFTVGSLQGGYQDTWSAGSGVEAITEVQTTAADEQVTNIAENYWAIEVQGGLSSIVHATVSAGDPGESFTFAYSTTAVAISTDPSSWVDMFTVSSENPGDKQFTLPADLSGTVYISVRDNQRLPGNAAPATVAIDYLAVRTVMTVAGPSEPPPTPAGELDANGYKVKGRQRVDLNWSGLNASKVDIYRNGNLLLGGGLTNTGSHLDNINRKGGASYNYKVCAAGTETCTNNASVVF